MNMKYIYLGMVVAASISDVLLVASDMNGNRHQLSKAGNFNLDHDITLGDDNAGRFLRSREEAKTGSNAASSDPVDEERQAQLNRVMSDVSHNIPSTIKKLQRSKTLTQLSPDEEIALITKFQAYMNERNSKLFAIIRDEMKVNPISMRDRLHLSAELKTKSMEQLANNPHFLLWMHFKRFIDSTDI